MSALDSFDHLVGTQRKRCRHFDADHFRRLQVHDRYEFRRLFDRKVSRFRALATASTGQRLKPASLLQHEMLAK
jgi:hypothetical protein